MNLAIYLGLLVSLLLGTIYRPVIGLAGLLCVQVLDFSGATVIPMVS